MNKRLLSLTLCIFIIMSVFAGCSGNNGPEKTDKLILKTFDEEVSIHSELQTKFLSGGREEVLKTVRGRAENSYPDGVMLSWKNEIKTDKELSGYTLLISENSDLSDAKKYEIKKTSQNIINLKIATEYFWKVTAAYGEKVYESEISSFKTQDAAPRNISAMGVTNVRDLGGWKTADGGRVKQGLLFRCGRLNNDKSGTVTVEERGLSVFKDDLKIKSEIDLRLPEGAKNHETSALGENIQYFFIPMNSEVPNIADDNKEQLVKVFNVLGNENNYPLIFHCSIGTDRTGAVAYMVNALLGVEKEDLYSDYLFSNFANIGNPRDTYAPNKYNEVISAAQGNTYAEKTYNYLLSIGVKKEDLDNTIKILKQK